MNKGNVGNIPSEGINPENYYKYNGKELHKDLEIEWSNYGFRFYDPAIARFTTVDPLASDFPSWTPYHYVHNNPILLIDPTGMSSDTFRISGSDQFVKQTQNDLNTLKNDPNACATVEFCETTSETIAFSEASSTLGYIQNIISGGSGDDNHVLSSRTSFGGDGVESESSEVLYHELVHARDITSGQTGLDSERLIKSNKVRARNEARAMQETNVIRQKKGKKIRTNYIGTTLLTKDNKIISGTKVGG